MSRIFTATAAARNIRLKRTRPFRPQTNGKAEAFNKIMQAEWACHRPYASNDERLDALKEILVYYNHRRPHAASARLLGAPLAGWVDGASPRGIDGATPASRL